ncbi:hypothetical protein DAI22_04g291550 [Oryza sativa Japonica Group]|nr:hypothetical protein DAI22_04g291550 [Oryza sativa Japonica Group]
MYCRGSQLVRLALLRHGALLRGLQLQAAQRHQDGASPSSSSSCNCSCVVSRKGRHGDEEEPTLRKLRRQSGIAPLYPFKDSEFQLALLSF